MPCCPQDNCDSGLIADSKSIHWLAIFTILTATGVTATEPSGEDPQQVVGRFLTQVCSDCHSGETSEANLDLSQLPWQLDSADVRRRWVHIHDRIDKGAMPPDSDNLSTPDRQALLGALSHAIEQADLAEVLALGRGPMRRLNRREYEQNLRDLLRLPQLDIRDMLPEDREGYHSNKSAETLDISRVQLAAYLDAADTALRAAVAAGVQPRQAVQHRLPATRMFEQAQTFGGREAMFYAKDSRMVPLSHAELSAIRKENRHDPEMEIAIFRSASWPYYGYPDTFMAVEPGAYRIRFSARAVRQVRDFRLRPARDCLPMTFRARKRSGPDVSGDVRATGGVMDIQPEVATYETTIRLKQNETFEYSLLGLPVPRAINPDNGPLYYDFPPMPEDGHPGIAFQWLEISGPIDSNVWPPPSHRVLFDDLPIRPASAGGRLPVELVSSQPVEEASRLLRRFVRHAQRQPVGDDAILVYERLIGDELERGTPLAEALLAGYNAFLCSGPFLYLPEPASVDGGDGHVHYAIATRLSHLLWNSRPDEQLMAHAEGGRLRDAAILRSETDRLIDTQAFNNFVQNFTDYWLSLKDLRRDEPDVRLYPEYRFDDYLIESMDAEARAFVTAMVRDNLPVTVLVDADFAFVNDRLARHYDLPPLSGSQVRKIDLPAASPYGGLLTQAAILKVTANGTTTSPVVRGAWVMERILGDPPPPPPATVPAVKPDIRGATSIREQLARHTADASCAACHARFDPVGFALENFDILGAWRDRYRSLGSGEEVTGFDRAGHAYAYRVAGPVDASGQLLSGPAFHDIRELKSILASDPRQLARNLLQQLTIYATGTPVRFSDRSVIEAILERCSRDGYRTRDLIHGLVQSRIFLGVTGLETLDADQQPRGG